jgi:hypothetical protein
MILMSRKVVYSIISGFSFIYWAIGIGVGNFFLTLISGVLFISFLVLACASYSLPPPPPELSIPPPPPPETLIPHHLHLKQVKLAHMVVPTLVKNGQNSPFLISNNLDGITQRTCFNIQFERQKQISNHF